MIRTEQLDKIDVAEMALHEAIAGRSIPEAYRDPAVRDADATLDAVVFESTQEEFSAWAARDHRKSCAEPTCPCKVKAGMDPAEAFASLPTVIGADGCDPADGRWYVSFTVDMSDLEYAPASKSAVGIDLGIKDFAVTSDGEKIPNPRHLERKARNLARYQRRLARCQKGSANRAKAKAKVARAHRKVRDSRRDFLHKTSTGLVRSHKVIVGGSGVPAGTRPGGDER